MKPEPIVPLVSSARNRWSGHQIVKDGRQVRLFSKSGNDLTKRLASLAAEIAGLPVRKAVIDGELVLVDERNVPNFYKLHRTLMRLGYEPFACSAAGLFAFLASVRARDAATP